MEGGREGGREGGKEGGGLRRSLARPPARSIPWNRGGGRRRPPALSRLPLLPTWPPPALRPYWIPPAGWTDGRTDGPSPSSTSSQPPEAEEDCNGYPCRKRGREGERERDGCGGGGGGDDGKKLRRRFRCTLTAQCKIHPSRRRCLRRRRRRILSTEQNFANRALQRRRRRRRASLESRRGLYETTFASCAFARETRNATAVTPSVPAAIPDPSPQSYSPF